ncbi:MAG: hypothetical protein KGN34_07860 [Sphingomonadales bacterium]|nr:hypothetical protein [Sphingomonadales bacterium]
MKLTAETVLDGVTDGLRDQIAPLLQDGFAREALRMAQSAIAIVARGMDDAVAIRVTENARIRDLLGQGAAVAGDDLSARLAAAAASRNPGLRISQLDVECDRLRRLLIELHAWLEQHDGEAARALDRAIWQALREFEAARAPRA